MQELHASIRSQLAVQAADLRALAHRLTSGPEAEDCVQNTMVAALSQREPPRQLRPWLRRVLRNEIHAHHRIGARRRNREHQIAAGEPMPTLDDHAEREQIVAALRMVLDALEEPYRSTLRRRFLLEHPTTRIARDEGCSPATVRWRAHEGLRRMRRMLDERFEGRQQWLGGMALYASGPVDGATPVIGEGAKTTMTDATTTALGGTILTKLALAGITAAGLALASAAVVTTSTVEATPAPTHERSEPILAAAVSSAGATPVLVADQTRASTPCDDERCEPALVAATDEAATETPLPTFAGGNGSPGEWNQTLVDCVEAFDPDHQWPRYEIQVRGIGGRPGEPASFETLEITTGRQIPCTDPVDEPTPADADGVQRHPELVECLMASVDVEQMLGSLMPGETREMGMVFVNDDTPLDAIPGGPLPEADPTLAATEPELAPVALGLPVRGSIRDDAIAVVECIDYDCPYCRKAQASVDQLLDQHPEVAFHVLANPLSMHRGAPIAARAAVAAGDQGEFWAMHEALFEDPAARTAEALVAKARALGLDVERFERDLLSESTGRRVATQAAVCLGAGARGTPSFFVGGDLVTGAQGYEPLAEAVEFELSQRR